MLSDRQQIQADAAAFNKIHGTPGIPAAVKSECQSAEAACLACLAWLTANPAPVPSPVPSPASTPVPFVPAGTAVPTKLILDEDFTSLDLTRWAPDWFGDGHTQNGTVMKAANVSVSGGSLALALAADGSGALASTNPSGGGGFAFTYGYAEARMFLPAAANGLIANWPAFWLTGQLWPTDGEIDIMEGLGGSAAWHFHWGAAGSASQAVGESVNASPGWHTYGCHWQADRIDYFYDGKLVGSVTSGVTDQPLYVVLENSKGTPAVEPASVLVDYVRVWQ